MTTDPREPYEVVRSEHPAGGLLARIDALGAEVYARTGDELAGQVRLAILNRGGNPERGIKWREEG